MDNNAYEIDCATQKDIPIIEDILLDAVRWMRTNKLDNLWNELNTKWNG